MADVAHKKRLGRGLSALIGDIDAMAAAGAVGAEAAAPGAAVRSITKLPIESIRPNPANPRRAFPEAELEELAGSIRERGIVQPVLVRPVAEGYEIIAGERRWRAAARARLHEIPVIVREATDGEALELAIIENVQRADLNPLEEARGYQQLIEEFRYSQDDLGGLIGKSRSHVANTLRLLKLPEAVQAYLRDGQLTAVHARAALASGDPAEFARQMVERGLSVRQAEALAATAGSHALRPRSRQRTASPKPADTVALERRLEAHLGLKVAIDDRDGSGELRIRYTNLEQLDELCRLLEYN
jgi:ParB family chromosome partitioning protein